ncbi:UDP-3-O-(3-hydroxymyristoyl)glucosamine N-acyltransferase [Dinoroseobacter sp. S124A]|uniref:UDP-3-O-(3-hydroxymyristoyl)glucosamine N-acyltransferase n=1 Tax=Dinoroseobacter sp. S124A TaxID=3415128 RepID=UPI003C7AE101
MYSLGQIAEALGAEVAGNAELTVTGASEPGSAGPTDLALAMDPKYADGLSQGQARAAMLWGDAPWKDYGLDGAVLVKRARYAMSGLTTLLDPGPEIATGIHPMAIVDPSAEIGANAAIGPFVVIGRGARIGANARIAPHVMIAEGAEIGDDVLIHAGVKIGARVRIGHRVFLQPGACIGADGFSFVTPETSAVEEVRKSVGDRGDAAGQSWTRIHSLGAVEIGDDVEIGANACLDRGTIRDTKIGRGTKLDNLVHIGHNVQVGEDCLLCGQVGIAGSSRIGNRVVLAGQVGVNDNIFVGDDVIAGGATKIFTNAPAGRVLLGYPAMKMQSHVESYKAIRRLPRLIQQVADLQKAVSKRGEND